MHTETVRKELQTHEDKLKSLGFRDGIIEFLLANPSVDTGLFKIRHVVVEEEDMRERMRGSGGSNYRTDIFCVERGDHQWYYRIRCEFDSWDTYEWDMIEITEVARKTKTIAFWEEVK